MFKNSVRFLNDIYLATIYRCPAFHKIYNTFTKFKMYKSKAHIKECVLPVIITQSCMYMSVHTVIITHSRMYMCAHLHVHAIEREESTVKKRYNTSFKM